MNLKRMLLMAALGLTASALSSYAVQVQVIDVFNLSGQGPQLFGNSGGGNQHGQSQNPLFAFNGDLPLLIFQRSSFNGTSYLQLYQGPVTQNQAPPPTGPLPTGSMTIVGSTASVANPPDFVIDFRAPNNAAAQQIQAILVANPTSVYTVAVVEVSNNKPKTRGSIQFQFPNLKVINGQLSPNLNITTQLGNG